MLFPTPLNLKIAYYQHKPKTPPLDKHLQTHCAHYAAGTTRNLGPTEVSKEKPGMVVCPSTEETVLEGPFAPRSSRPAWAHSQDHLKRNNTSKPENMNYVLE